MMFDPGGTSSRGNVLKFFKNVLITPYWHSTRDQFRSPERHGVRIACHRIDISSKRILCSHYLSIHVAERASLSWFGLVCQTFKLLLSYLDIFVLCLHGGLSCDHFLFQSGQWHYNIGYRVAQKIPMLSPTWGWWLGESKPKSVSIDELDYDGCKTYSASSSSLLSYCWSS